jgi:hypothetical protein
MKQIGMSYFDDVYLTLIALGIFFIFFTWQVFVLYFKKNGSEYSQIERMIFDDSFHPPKHSDPKGLRNEQ